MNDPQKVKALVRVGKLLGRSELETLFAASYQAVKTGKTMTAASAANKSFTFTILQGMGPADVFSLVDEALSTFDQLTTLGRLDVYLGPVFSTGSTCVAGAIGAGCAPVLE